VWAVDDERLLVDLLEKILVNKAVVNKICKKVSFIKKHFLVLFWV